MGVPEEEERKQGIKNLCEVRRGDYRNSYKGHMDKIKGEGGGGGGRWVQLEWGGGNGIKGRQL